jgi:hypothetical protein
MLEQEQGQYRGMVFGAGTPYVWRKTEGLVGQTARVGDRDLPRGDGAVPGQHFLDPKAPILTIAVHGDKATLLPPLLQAFRVSRDVEHPLTWRDTGWPERRVWARVVSRVITDDGPYAVEVPIALRCSDPRVYSDAEVVVSVPLSAGDAGYDDILPGDLPFDGDVPGTTAVMEQDGDSDAYPLVRFFGGSGTATEVQLLNVTNGSVLTVETDIVGGQVLSCDMRAYVTGRTDRRIIDLSGASRYGSWTSRPDPLFLNPGENVLRFTASGTTTGLQANLTYRHTFDGAVSDA